MHLNSRSLKSNYATFITEFSGLGLEIITISESWFKTIDLPTSYQLKGYTLYRLDRQVLKRPNKVKIGGGVCIYVKQGIEHDYNFFEDLNTSDKDIEVQFLLICKPKMKQQIIVNVYRPPDGDVTSFIDSLSDLISNIKNREKYEILLLGDMNIDVNIEDDESETLLANLNAYALKQYIKNPTRYSTKNSILDLCFTNMGPVAQAGILNIHVSDHLPIYLVRKKINIKPVKIWIIGRSYIKFNHVTFCSDLDSYDWTLFETTDDIDTKWAEY